MRNPVQWRRWRGTRLRLPRLARRLLSAWPFAAAAMLGAVAYAWLGESPQAAVSNRAADLQWELPAPVVHDLASQDPVWQSRAPWGSLPQPEVPPPPPPPPPPVPVAIVAAGRGFEAVFVVPGGGEVRVRPGSALPDGGRVKAITRANVVWTDGAGQEQSQEFFGDRLRPMTSGATP